MSARRMKKARTVARLLERQVDLDARARMRVPWYIVPFPRWTARWWLKWDAEHRKGLHRATKRMAHLLR